MHYSLISEDSTHVMRLSRFLDIGEWSTPFLLHNSLSLLCPTKKQKSISIYFSTCWSTWHKKKTFLTFHDLLFLKQDHVFLFHFFVTTVKAHKLVPSILRGCLGFSYIFNHIFDQYSTLVFALNGRFADEVLASFCLHLASFDCTHPVGARNITA